MAPPQINLQILEDVQNSTAILNDKISNLLSAKRRNEEHIEHLLEEVTRLKDRNATIDTKITRLTEDRNKLYSVETLAVKARNLVFLLGDENVSDEEILSPVEKQKIENGSSKTEPDAADVSDSDDEILAPIRRRRIVRGKNKTVSKDGRHQSSECQFDELRSHEVRELIQIVKSVARTRDGQDFCQPVAKLWPNFAAAYAQKISNPIDLETMEYRLQNKIYKTMNDVRADIQLLFNNALTFNGPGSTFTFAAGQVRDALLNRIANI
ncbi:hypothetical protein EG329_011644 [Mollisiaceae sp. DMI_Dod_QoI]|nr:hypothetical protein EG329_011644 [Helotiales sp. DMI_Dod_QoI]